MFKISESIEKGKCKVRALKNDRKRSGRHQNTYLYDLTRRKGLNFIKSQNKDSKIEVVEKIVYPPFGFYPNKFELIHPVPIGVYPTSLSLHANN
jgi:hypothetical protein